MKKLTILALALVILLGGFMFASPANAQSFNIGIRQDFKLDAENADGSSFHYINPRVALGFAMDIFTFDFKYQSKQNSDGTYNTTRFEVDLGLTASMPYFSFTAKSELDINNAYSDTPVGFDYKLKATPKFSMPIIEGVWMISVDSTFQFKSGEDFSFDGANFYNTFLFGPVAVNFGAVATGWYWMPTIDDGYFHPDYRNMLIIPINMGLNASLGTFGSLSVGANFDIVAAPDVDMILGARVSMKMNLVPDTLTFKLHWGMSLNLLKDEAGDPINMMNEPFRMLIRAELGINIPVKTGEEEEIAVEEEEVEEEPANEPMNEEVEG